MSAARDHGGGVDAAVAQYGGRRADWIDLSTGINPVAYPLPDLVGLPWTTLPDSDAQRRVIEAARAFWGVPDRAAVLPLPGASAAIARLPHLRPAGSVDIPGPTYNEHAAAFAEAGWGDGGDARVIVHPNNPDGRVWSAAEALAGDPALLVIDESFCDIAPADSLVHLSDRPGTVVLKSFGKFWGLAGLRLGFAIGDPDLLAALARALGPWPVSGPALEIGRQALNDPAWAAQTRARLIRDADALDTAVQAGGATLVGGTTLFRLYEVADAAQWQDRLARHRIWSRIFPYSRTWLRLGLPHPDSLPRVKAALG